MTTHVVASIGVLALLTLAPGPDLAVVTRRAVAFGRAEGREPRPAWSWACWTGAA